MEDGRIKSLSISGLVGLPESSESRGSTSSAILPAMLSFSITATLVMAHDIAAFLSPGVSAAAFATPFSIAFYTKRVSAAGRGTPCQLHMLPLPLSTGNHVQ